MPDGLAPAPKRLLLGGAAAVILFLGTVALAQTGSQEAISNRVTMSYKDAGGVTQTPETATATVAVTQLTIAASSPAGDALTRAANEPRLTDADDASSRAGDGKSPGHSSSVRAAGCEIDAEPILLTDTAGDGQATSGKGVMLSGTAAITLYCSPGTAYEVVAGHGRHYAGGRRMRDDVTATYVGYGLFLDPDHTVSWDDDRPMRGVAGAAAAAHFTVYARFHVEEIAPQAHYADAIDVRVDYY